MARIILLEQIMQAKQWHREKHTATGQIRNMPSHWASANSAEQQKKN